MGKLSKSDDPQAKQEIANLGVSRHFTTGSFVVTNNRRAEILAVHTKTWPHRETHLRLAWEDGTVSLIKPIALNPHGLHH